MKVGDLVIALQDERAGFDVVGLVLEINYMMVHVLWSSESSPRGWWRKDQLRVAHESR